MNVIAPPDNRRLEFHEDRSIQIWSHPEGFGLLVALPPGTAAIAKIKAIMDEAFETKALGNSVYILGPDNGQQAYDYMPHPPTKELE